MTCRAKMQVVKLFVYADLIRMLHEPRKKNDRQVLTLAIFLIDYLVFLDT